MRAPVGRLFGLMATIALDEICAYRAATPGASFESGGYSLCSDALTSARARNAFELHFEHESRAARGYGASKSRV
jgi:hypothetical protein